MKDFALISKLFLLLQNLVPFDTSSPNTASDVAWNPISSLVTILFPSLVSTLLSNTYILLLLQEKFPKSNLLLKSFRKSKTKSRMYSIPTCLKINHFLEMVVCSDSFYFNIKRMLYNIFLYI